MKKNKLTALIAGAGVTALLLTGCLTKSEDMKERESKQDNSLENSLELRNLEERMKREDDPNAVRYVYIVSFAKPIGYYVAKGKISSSGSQIAPEQDLIKIYDNSSERYTVDSAKDDGSYGSSDPGIFFFTSAGIMVETDMNYIISEAPIDTFLDVPKLGGEEE